MSGDCTAEANSSAGNALSDLLHGETEETDTAPDDEYWRREVAARLQRYRSRRKVRAPRYPSLRLPFDSAERVVRAAEAAPLPPAPVLAPASGRENVALQVQEVPAEPVPYYPPLFAGDEQDASAKIIEFPRSAAIPVPHRDELADPVFERPRIVEAPEVVPPPPALGGILIESAEKEAPKRAEEDFPLDSASVARRLLAGLVDTLILLVALAGFAAIFLRFNPQRPPVIPLAVAGVAVSVFVWGVYEFLFVVYTGSTPGLRATRTSLVRFDGSPVPRRLRRWRVLACYLSALSLGLGYLWSLLDEDGLCWHDRITRTHIR